MRLIDADEIEELFREVIGGIAKKPEMTGSLEHMVRVRASAMVIQMLQDAPTVDAVPVVRCKDCKHWKTAEGVNLSKRVRLCTYHIWHQYARHDEDFCSRGERKDGDYHD